MEYFSIPADSLFNKPEECGMGGGGCSVVVAGWTLGDNGDCLSLDFGVPVGIRGKKWIVLQVRPQQEIFIEYSLTLLQTWVQGASRIFYFY